MLTVVTFAALAFVLSSTTISALRVLAAARHHTRRVGRTRQAREFRRAGCAYLTRVPRT